MKINHSDKRKLIPRIFLAAQTIAFVALAASSSIPSTSALTVLKESRSIQIESDQNLSWQRRHGDHEHEEKVEEVKKVVVPVQVEQHGKEDDHQAMQMEHEHMHSSIENEHNQMKGHLSDHHHHSRPHPYDHVPDPSAIGLAFIQVPPLPHGAGGHSHGHGGEAPKEELNETVILRGKGPDPLSYIEWDFNYGLGKPDELERFVNAYNQEQNSKDWIDLMGVSGGRYRHLVDELQTENRKSVIMDIQRRVQTNKQFVGRHRMLLILHVLGCIVSCFIMLPAALALRAASSSLAPFASLMYLITLAGSLFASMLYKAITPRLYPSNSHSGLGYTIFWLSLIALGGDVFRLVYQIYLSLRSLRRSNSNKPALTVFLDSLSLSKTYENSSAHSGAWEYDPLEEERMLSEDGISDAQELDLERMNRHTRNSRQRSTESSGSASPIRSVHFVEEEEEVGESPNRRSWSRDLPSPSSTLLNTPRTSIVDALPVLNKIWKLDPEHQGQIQTQEAIPAWRQHAHSHHQREKRFVEQPKKKTSILKSIFRYSHVTVARSIPVLAFAAAYTGLSVYTGSCRGPYKNVCLAHGIKGGIFFWYGLLSFARYLGAYADLGWAWNKKPTRKSSGGKKVEESSISAEWVESCVIFVYGATNTWMERFGAQPGDPYTVKQVQHISIAVMFWFAGLMGMILEVRSLKNLLAFPVSLKQSTITKSRKHSKTSSSHPSSIGSLSADELVTINQAPPSYGFSFNPFPALVIGVTGIAMAAHHQDYVYEVSIHSLWGNLLAGFSALRFLTYFLLWLRPPTNSIMPSRPPTEALASFSLTCGGLVFMLSSEEVSFVAMRNGFGDFMMILNVTVAIVALLFCWIAGIMVLKAWALKREHKRRMLSEDSSIRLEEVDEPSANVNTTDHQFNNFIIGTGEEEEEEDEESNALEQDEKRQLSSSPEQL